MQDSVKPSSDETQYFRQHPAPPTFDFMDELKFKLKHKQQQISILENIVYKELNPKSGTFQQISETERQQKIHEKDKK